MIDLIGTRTLNDLLAERVARHPDKSWIVFEDRNGTVVELTYREFSAQVDAVASGLAQRGISKGDTVVLHLRNSPEFLVTWFAFASLGAVMVPSNVANTVAELEYIIDYSEAVAAVTQPDYVDMFKVIASSTPTLHTIVVARLGDTPDVPSDTVSYEELARGSRLERPTVPIEPDDVLEMLFTSGTTAKPKGVLLTHANALYSGERTARGLGLEGSDRCLTSLPLFHVNAQSLTVLGALTAGGTVVILEEFSASRYWSQIQRHGATQTSIVAMQARTLLAQPPAEDDGDHALRRCMYAINITDSEKDEFERRFAVRFINGYGLSEAMTIVSLSPLFGPQRWPSIGLPAMDRKVRVVDDDGMDVPVGEIGEIIVWGVPGRNIMKGYFKDPESTASTIRDGWLHTGDHGYIDEYGYLYFFDRQKDVIKRAGENVSASEVEGVLVDHSGVLEAAVIAVPDPIRDEAVKAFLVLSPEDPPTVEEIQEYCRGRLARFKVPTEIEILDELPKTSIGKVEKKVLRSREP